MSLTLRRKSAVCWGHGWAPIGGSNGTPIHTCLATIANMLHRSLKMSLPEVLRGNAATFFSLEAPPEAGDIVMFLYITFAVRERDISGYIAMIMDMPSLTALTHLLDEFIERTAG